MPVASEQKLTRQSSPKRGTADKSLLVKAHPNVVQRTKAYWIKLTQTWYSGQKLTGQSSPKKWHCGQKLTGKSSPKCGTADESLLDKAHPKSGTADKSLLDKAHPKSGTADKSLLDKAHPKSVYSGQKLSNLRVRAKLK